MSLIALLLAPALTSCSLLLVKKPPPRPPKAGPIKCTSSNAAPAIDVLIAGLQLVRVIYALSQDDSDYEDFPISRGADIGLGVGFAAIFGSSAAYGFKHTAACTALERKRDRSEALRAANMGCRRDDQCKGNRICEAGYCVQPVATAPNANTAADPRSVAPPNGPGGAYGHDFGTTLEAVREACTAGGGELTATGTDIFECRLATPPQGDAPIVSLRFCANTLCELDATYPFVPPTFHEWVQRYDRIEANLKRQLGPPTEQHRSMASSCATDYGTCFGSERTSFSALWRWPNQRQVWLRNTQQGLVRLTFTAETAPAAEVHEVYE